MMQHVDVEELGTTGALGEMLGAVGRELAKRRSLDVIKKAKNTRLRTPSELQGWIASLSKAKKAFADGQIIVMETRIPEVSWNVGDAFVVVSTAPVDVDRVRPRAKLGCAVDFDTAFGDMIVARPTPVDMPDGIAGVLFLTCSGFFRVATPEEIDTLNAGTMTVYDRDHGQIEDEIGGIPGAETPENPEPAEAQEAAAPAAPGTEAGSAA